MLVLSRKKHEVIHIGDDVTVMVIRIAGDQVRLGIEAPRHIEVDRREVRERKIAEAERLVRQEIDVEGKEVQP